TWFALGVDLAGVELLALCLITDDLVRHVELGETGGGLRIVLVGVGMVLLGKLAKCALDLSSARGLLHPQDLVGVSHEPCLPSRALAIPVSPLTNKRPRKETGPANDHPRIRTGQAAVTDAQYLKLIWGRRGIFATCPATAVAGSSLRAL